MYQAKQNLTAPSTKTRINNSNVRLLYFIFIETEMIGVDTKAPINVKGDKMTLEERIKKEVRQ